MKFFRLVGKLTRSRRIGITLDVDIDLPCATCHASFEDDTFCVEMIDLLYGSPNFRKGDTTAPVHLEHAAKDVVYFGRDRKDGRKEIKGILEVCLECGVGRGCRLPRIAASGEVQEYNGQRPDVVE